MVRLEKSFSFTLFPKAPYSFELTIKKPAGWDLFTPFEVFQNGTMWTALHVGETLVGLRLSSGGKTDSPKIMVTSFQSDDSGATEALLERVLTEKLGVNDDLGEFYRFAKKDPILKHTVKDLYGMHDTLGGSVFDIALLAICLQLAPFKRSEQMMDSLVNKYGEVAEFDGRAVRVWPTAGELFQSIDSRARERM